MKYLMENETGFDTAELGFPSIQGCHAIVYQTPAGLYGFHVAGGSGDAKWPHNARHFKNFVQRCNNNALPANGSRLYGVTYVGNNQRGYSVTAFNKRNYHEKWKQELVEFASKLTYTGKISGYDLHKTLGDNTSAFVKYVKNGDKCDVSVAKWTGPVKPPRAANAAGDHHMGRVGTMDNPRLAALPTVVTSVSGQNLTRVSKEKLR